MAETMSSGGELPQEIGEPSSVLTDADIAVAMGRGYLFSSGADADRVKYSTYELRIEDYEILTFESVEDRWSKPKDRRPDCVVLEPGETARVFAAEVFDVPSNVMGHATPVGQLFASGLAAETTFADPGYRGNFYVTLINLSTKVLTIPYGSPLARVEFYKLGKSVAHPHDGQRRSPSFVEPSRPAYLTQTDFAGCEPAAWVARLGEFSESERYDRRHHITSHVLANVGNRLARTERDVLLLQAGLLLVGGGVLILAVVGVWSLMPDTVQDEVTSGAAGAIAGALLTVPVLLSRALRVRFKALMAFSLGRDGNV